MKTAFLAACTFTALLLAGCATDAPRTSLRPGPYDPNARIRQAEMESRNDVILVPYGMYGGYGYPGPYYGGSIGYGYYGYGGYGVPWYGYGMPGPVIVPRQPQHQQQPAPPQQQTPNNPPRTFRDLFPGAKP